MFRIKAIKRRQEIKFSKLERNNSEQFCFGNVFFCPGENHVIKIRRKKAEKK